MGAIIILDTSILLNILNVPRRCTKKSRENVDQQLEKYLEEGAEFRIPLGVVLETGNHIAGVGNGNQRRKLAKALQDYTKTLEEESHKFWFALPLLPRQEDLKSWLDEFPDSATKGVGLVDLSIIKAWEEAREKYRSRNVRIWSLDEDLRGYDHVPGPSRKPG